METAFWISFLLVAYVYAGYPIAVYLMSRTIGRKVRKSAYEPRVSILIAAYNEAESIGRTIRNKLELDYPPGKLEVVVISDASDDATDNIVSDFGDRVRLLRQNKRAGKTAALNVGVSNVSGEILVFSDANSLYSSQAIRRLVDNFSDADVGYVTGKMVYANPDGSLVGDGCSNYMKYENALRSSESLLGSVIGVDGGIDAIRRELYQPMRADQLPDFVLPLTVSAGGSRVVYEPGALLKEDALTDEDDEYRMRVRVSLRALWALWDMRFLLNPFRFPMLSWQIWSHKVLRYLAIIPLMATWIFGGLLVKDGLIFALIAAGQSVFFSIAGYGWLSRRSASSSWISLPFYFMLLNVAAAQALFRFLGGQRQATWPPRKG